MRGEPSSTDLPKSRTEALRASPPFFRSPLLDRLTRVHPAVPPLIFVPVIALLVVLALRTGSLEETLIGLAAGWLVWTLVEYWTHRVVFHFEPEDGVGVRLHWMVHGVHHDHPNDPRRLVLPPVVSVPFGALFFGLFLLLPDYDGLAVSAGFFAGYLAYDMLHFALHHHRPRSRVARLLHELHMRHHFEDEHRGFGVSAPWWDVLFGTYSTRARHRRAQAEAAGHQPRS
jgi:dihydroceramide fatty acyl 2-hydroxylase